MNGSEEFAIDFGSYALTMYYAKQLNPVLGKFFFDATISEYHYRVNYELPRGNYSDEDNHAHFVLNDLQEVILFLENQLLPSLNNENINLIVQYGGINNFIELFYTSPEYLNYIGIDEDEYFEGDGPQLAFQLEDLKNLFQNSLLNGQPYDTFTY